MKLCLLMVVFKTRLFKIRARLDTYQDEQRVRYDVVAVHDIDIKQECQFLLDQISQLDNVEAVN